MLSFIFSLASLSTANAAITKIPQIGAHEKVLIFEKNENPQNLLVLYTKLDDSCRPTHESGDEKPLVGYYWLMDGANYKPVHPMIKNGIDKRVLVETGPDHSIVMHLTDLKELKNDLKDPKVEIKARRGVKGCEVEALMPLGPSDGQATMRIAKIHTESEKTALPPFRKVVSVTLEGVNAKTGAPLKRTFSNH